MVKYFSYGELFCGPGGLSLGALKAQSEKDGVVYKLKHQWASDFDPDSCETYRRNICPETPDSVICADVRTELDIPSLEKIDAFAYGFPCNDFSVVGEQKGFNGNFGPLYTYGIKVLNAFDPVFFIGENVGGIRSANNGKAFRKILNDLENSGKHGYNLTVHLYKTEEYGIPQTRHRVIIVGINKKYNLTFKVPKPSFITRTAREALEEPPIPLWADNQEITKQSKTVIERLKHIKPGENAWNSALPEDLKLNVKMAKLSHIYKRLDPEKPSYTITGSGGGGTHVYHWLEDRALTNRERARIQTFPDNYSFAGSKESVRKQIGMAVPPDFAEIIFTSVLNTITGISYPYIQPNYTNDVSLFEMENGCDDRSDYCSNSRCTSN